MTSRSFQTFAMLMAFTMVLMLVIAIPPATASEALLATQISTGVDHTCALNDANQVVCWGLNAQAQATPPENLGESSQISAGHFHTCALKADGSIACWGSDARAQTRVPSDLGQSSQVSAGNFHTCALKADGSIACWGQDLYGPMMTVPNNLGRSTQLSAGGFHTCALHEDGSVRCWDWYGNFQNLPSNLGMVTQVSAGGEHSCALQADGLVRCWGANTQGQTSVPNSLGPITQISAGGWHTCALTENGRVRCWGMNNHGQSTVPNNLGRITQISAGGEHTCALDEHNKVRCWGQNDYSQTFVPGDPDVGPLLQSVTPSEATHQQATLVTVRGNGFATETPHLVQLMGVAGTFPLTDVTPDTATRFSATVPAGLEAGIYDLVVTISGRALILPNAFIVLTPDSQPELTALVPDAGLNDMPVELLIQGANFKLGAEVHLGDTPLDSTRLNQRLLLATVPSGLTPDRYAVRVTNPDGGTVSLAAGYRVLDANADLNNDLFSSNDHLWLDPVTPRVGVPTQLGLLVERMGGKNVLEDVAVVFRRDAVDGPILGQGSVEFLDPRSMESTTPIEVTFDAVGEVTIFAIIDPENMVAEHNEDNNVVQRTVFVAPVMADRIPPVVQRILINGGTEALVTSPAISVGVDALDPTSPPPSSGMSHISLIEYIYSDGIKRWVPVERSGWLPYLQNPTSYQWTLRPVAGMRYIQIRARDRAGNVSVGNARRLVNYEPASDTIARNQTRVYRYTLEQGQAFEVNLEVLEGDADLYVWAEQDEQSAWVSNLSGDADERVFIPADQVVAGTYQVEVYGYTAATYRLNTNVAANPATLATLATGGLDPEKPQPGAPVVQISSIPSEHMGGVPSFVPELEQSGHTVFLPLVRR